MNTAGHGSESQHQQSFVAWWSVVHRTFGLPEAALFAIPNGGARSMATGARLRKEGVRAGIPDMLLAVPAGQAHGLFLEMKRCRGGRVSKAQKATMGVFESLGYQVAVCYGCRDAIAAVEKYLEGAQ